MVRRKALPHAPQRGQPDGRPGPALSLRTRLLWAVALAGFASVLLAIWCLAPWQTGADSVLQASTKLQHEPTVPLDSTTEQSAVPIRLNTEWLRPGTRYAAIEQLAEKANSQNDSWQTEVLSEAASAQLGRLAQQLERPNIPDVEFLRSVIAREFECQTLRPTDHREVYRDGVLTVRRGGEENPFPNALDSSKIPR